jgi:hypothetical protein
MIPDNTDDPHHDGFCCQCGDVTEGGPLCEECQWGEDHAPEEDEPATRFVYDSCVICGRGLVAEDFEMNNGMCVPCSQE